MISLPLSPKTRPTRYSYGRGACHATPRHTASHHLTSHHTIPHHTTPHHTTFTTLPSRAHRSTRHTATPRYHSNHLTHRNPSPGGAQGHGGSASSAVRYKPRNRGGRLEAIPGRLGVRRVPHRTSCTHRCSALPPLYQVIRHLPPNQLPSIARRLNKHRQHHQRYQIR